MMTLPAVDLGIMAEHLSTHEGVINKLKMYDTSADNAILKDLIRLHMNILRNHVTAMLGLINPDQDEEIRLPEIDKFHFDMGTVILSDFEKDLARECKATAKLMGSDNFNSALMMKDANVKNVHLQMAYQNITMQMLYDHLLKTMNVEFIPRVSKEVQRLTFREYYHVSNE